LVASAVQRERPPKKPMIAVDLPADVQTFISDYNQARYNKDIEKMSAMISDRFLHEGVTKQMAVRFLTGAKSYTSEAKIIITRFELVEEKAEVDIWLKDKYFESLFMKGSGLTKKGERRSMHCICPTHSTSTTGTSWIRQPI
jgi:hypothetical protein